MVTEMDVELADGRILHTYQTRPEDSPNPGDRRAVFWQHGTPNTGAPPEPLFAAAAERGLEWVSYDRPGYGGSTPNPGRDVASAAADVAAVADALGLRRFAVIGHSGGGPHALACAAMLPERVVAAASLSGLAPVSAEGLDWFAGMVASGAAELRAAIAGRAALEHRLAVGGYDPEMFTPEDHAVLEGEWSWLARVAEEAIAAGSDAMVDDDLAYVAAWGFDPAPTSMPVLLVHGGRDRTVPSSHSEWLASRNPSAQLWLRPDDGHVSVLRSAPAVLGWVRDRF